MVECEGKEYGLVMESNGYMCLIDGCGNLLLRHTDDCRPHGLVLDTPIPFGTLPVGSGFKIEGLPWIKISQIHGWNGPTLRVFSLDSSVSLIRETLFYRQGQPLSDQYIL